VRRRAGGGDGKAFENSGRAARRFCFIVLCFRFVVWCVVGRVCGVCCYLCWLCCVVWRDEIFFAKMDFFGSAKCNEKWYFL
jgi:hypothetical protein